MKLIKLIAISICAVVAVTACSKKKDGSVATAAVTYYSSNGICYDARTNLQTSTTNCNTLAYHFYNNGCYRVSDRIAVDMSNCNTTVGQYYYRNGSCFDKNANANCAQSYCTTTGSTVGRYKWENGYICVDTQNYNQRVSESYCLNAGGTNQQCVESNRYLSVDAYNVGYPVNCAVTNCRGQRLWDLSTLRYVDCAL